MEFLNTLLIIVFVLFVNAVFAAYEMAIASVSRPKLTVFINEKRRGAEEAAFMKDRMEASLAVVQVGITFLGAIAAATGGASVVDSFAPYLQQNFGLSQWLSKSLALVLLVIPLSCSMIIFAELVPKVFAINNKEWVCLKLSPVMKILSQIVFPIVLFFEWIVKKIIGIGKKHWNPPSIILEDQHGLHELKAAATVAKAGRLIGTREEKIVLSAAQLSLRPVKAIMLSVEEISMIPSSCTLSEALIKAHLDMHTRFPVCTEEGNPQTIRGYVNFKDIVLALKLNPSDPSIKGITRPLKTVDQNTPLAQVLESMMQEKRHITLVSDEEKIIGMVTLEDIIEELVGEIEDEFDSLPIYIHPYGESWIVGGGISMNILSQTAGVAWPPTESQGVSTLHEWCVKKLGRLPRGGETLEGNDLVVLVRKLRRKKLAEAVVSVSKT